MREENERWVQVGVEGERELLQERPIMLDKGAPVSSRVERVCVSNVKYKDGCALFHHFKILLTSKRGRCS